MIENRIRRDEHGHFAPNVSANPGGVPGRPKARVSITAQLREIGKEPDEQTKVEKVKALAEELWDHVLDRRLPWVERWPTIRDLIDRLDGKPVPTVGVDPESPTSLIFSVGVRRIGEDDGGDSDSADRN